MHAMHEQTWFIDVVLVWIIAGYLVIAWQFLRRFISSKTTEAKTALTQLVLIFVFCAFAGYLPRLVEIPAFILTVIHVLLAVFTWLYIIFGRVDRLVVAVDKDRLDEETLN